MILASHALLLQWPVALAFAPRRGRDGLGVWWTQASGAAGVANSTAVGGQAHRARAEEARSVSSLLQVQRKSVIALLVAVSSRSRTVEAAEDTDFFNMLFPSFLATTSPKEAFEYNFYVAYDVGDPFYDSSDGREEFEQLFLRRGGGAAPLLLHMTSASNATTDSSIDATRARLRWVSVAPYEDGGTGPVRAWNVAFQEAFSDGALYFYQLGEDIKLRTSGWASALTGQLHNQGDVGIVGGNEVNFQQYVKMPCVMVPRSHMSIFGTFYPTRMHNWWSDDWIYRSYKPFGLATKVPSVEVQNKRCTRYEVSFDEEDVAKELEKSSEEQIWEYLKLTGRAGKVQYPGPEIATDGHRAAEHTVRVANAWHKSLI